MVRIARFHRADSGSNPDVGTFLLLINRYSNTFQMLFNNITYLTLSYVK